MWTRGVPLIVGPVYAVRDLFGVARMARLDWTARLRSGVTDEGRAEDERRESGADGGDEPGWGAAGDAGAAGADESAGDGGAATVAQDSEAAEAAEGGEAAEGAKGVATGLVVVGCWWMEFGVRRS